MFCPPTAIIKKKGRRRRAYVKAAFVVVELTPRQMVKAGLVGDEVERLILGELAHFAPGAGAEK